MDTAVGSSVLIRGFRLALTVEGLEPHTAQQPADQGLIVSGLNAVLCHRVPEEPR